jgi:hypothetical protein
LPLLREPPKLLGKTGSATHGLRASIKFLANLQEGIAASQLRFHRVDRLVGLACKMCSQTATWAALFRAIRHIKSHDAPPAMVSRRAMSVMIVREPI